MKKLLLSLAILAGATLILTQDNTDDLKNTSTDEVVSVQLNLPVNI
ncbi:hypothetical protein [Winogradskyella wichelsiae]|nr:hypothetical protein [Winogradskyella wichelsiae]